MDKFKYNRRSIRLKNYDYSQNGTYFVTICTKNKDNFFGYIKNGKMVLNDLGKMVLNDLGIIANQSWINIKKYFPNTELKQYIIMPNHIHGIVQIVGVKNFLPEKNILKKSGTSKTIGSIVRGFKIGVTQYFDKQNIPPFNKKIWQRGYYEHIIRDDKDYYNIEKYIIENPLKWEEDQYYKIK